MPAIRELYYSYEIYPKKLSREENLILEADLFIRICDELKEIYRKNHKDFFRLLRLTTEMENEMLEANFIQCIIKDILSTQEYTPHGIAYYSGINEDVIHEIMIGLNTSPSLSLARRIIELHRSIRPDLYRDILKKITNEVSVST